MPLQPASATLQGKSVPEQRAYDDLFSDIQRVVDAKQLKPMVRTQFMRTGGCMKLSWGGQVGWREGEVFFGGWLEESAFQFALGFHCAIYLWTFVTP